MHLSSRFKVTIVFSLLLIFTIGLALLGFMRAPAQAVGTSLKPSTKPSCGAWTIVPSPNPGALSSRLSAVAGISASNVWAVGDDSDGTGLIEHWDGRSWNVVSSPSSGFNTLSGVTAVSADNVWAVGSTVHSGTSQTLIEHWDGRSWSVVSSPNIGSNDILYGVVHISRRDIWAVGYYINTNGQHQTLIEHWNGSSWSVVASPNPGSGDNHLNRVTAVSSRDVWAVGFENNGFDIYHTLIEHWNGTSWSVVSSPNRGSFDLLFGVTAFSASNVWAAGFSKDTQTSSTSQTLIEHWNGTSWSVISSPNPGPNSNTLNGVTRVPGTNQPWAVGDDSDSTGTVQTLIEHWNGISWSVVSSPNIGSNDILNDVKAVSASDVWAVGYYSNSLSTFGTLIEHWKRCK